MKDKLKEISAWIWEYFGNIAMLVCMGAYLHGCGFQESFESKLKYREKIKNEYSLKYEKDQMAQDFIKDCMKHEPEYKCIAIFGCQKRNILEYHKWKRNSE